MNTRTLHNSMKRGRHPQNGYRMAVRLARLAGKTQMANARLRTEVKEMTHEMIRYRALATISDGAFLECYRNGSLAGCATIAVAARRVWAEATESKLKHAAAEILVLREQVAAAAAANQALRWQLDLANADRFEVRALSMANKPGEAIG